MCPLTEHPPILDRYGISVHRPIAQAAYASGSPRLVASRSRREFDTHAIDESVADCRSQDIASMRPGPRGRFRGHLGKCPRTSRCATAANETIVDPAPLTIHADASSGGVNRYVPEFEKRFNRFAPRHLKGCGLTRHAGFITMGASPRFSQL